VAVGPLGFGAVPLGNLYRALPEPDAAATVEAGISAGIRYFDTAPFYGMGLSERRLGLYLRALPRDSYVLSTKVGRTLTPGAAGRGGIFVDQPPFSEAFDFSYDGVMRQFEDSLQRLGVDRIDCLVIHDLGLWHMQQPDVVDRHFRVLEAGGLKALVELKRDGRIGAIGAGANELTVCDRFLALGEIDFILLALRYTLLDQTADDGFLEKARAHAVSVVVGAPFQSGILATGVGPGARYNYGDTPADIVATVSRLEAACLEHEVPLKAAALQFPMQNPAMVSVLAGMGSPDEVRDNFAMAAFDIPASFWIALKEGGLTR
jgi:D-threo-aldose 1-dehydrogenase